MGLVPLCAYMGADVDEKCQQLLHLCLQSRWRPDALEDARALASQEEVEWSALLDKARAEGVAPLLYDAIRGQHVLPPRVEQGLERDYFATARRNVLLLQQLEEALRRFEQAHIPVIVLKGAALAQAVYRNVALRPMWDIDLLVQERHVPTAIDALADCGFVPYRAEASDPRDVHANQLLLHKPGRAETLIELHWALFWFPYYQRTLPMDAFWRTSRAIRIGEVSGGALGPEALLLHLCAHLVHHQLSDGACRLLWLHDVAELTVFHRGRIDWAQLVDQASAFDLVVPLGQVLTRIAELWQAPVPPQILEQVHHLRPSPSEKRALAGLASLSESMDRYAFVSLAALPNWRSKLAFLWHDLVFPSPGFMRRRYRVPHRLLVPIYYPYRWFRGLRSALSAAFAPPP